MDMGKILIASRQAPHLQHIIEPYFKIKADLWSENTSLLNYITTNVPDLLIADLSIIPNTDFYQQLKHIHPIDTKILLLAPFEQRQLAIEHIQQGATDCLYLPLNANEVTLKVSQAFQQKSIQEKSTQKDSSTQGFLLLREASQEINKTLQLDEVLKIILAKAEQITRADLAKVYLADQMGQLDKSRSVAKTSPLTDKPRESHLLFTLSKTVALRNEVFCQEKGTETIWDNQILESILVLPLGSKEKLIGVLALGSQRPKAFSQNHIRWLSIFCGQATTSLENARLFQDLASAYIDLAQSREQILQSRNTLQVLFDGISDGLYILDENLTVTALNQVEATRQGSEVEALIGKSSLELSWSQTAPDLINRIQEALQTGQETTWISPEYETEPYLQDREFRIYPIRNRLAQIEQVVVFAQDVSERRRLQASLFRSANLAAVGQLAGNIAHQINNPLTIAMANSQLLLLEVEKESELHELSAGIFKAGERIQGIVENLLEFSNQETYFFVKTDLVNTIEGALALILRSLKKAKIEVVKNYQVEPTLSASNSHLKLVWMNLLLNARDAVQGYADQPQITISTEAISNREVKVSITDNGCGVKEKDMEQLFRPFYTTKLANKAVGLGLYSAHTIVEKHNGHIKVSSSPGEFSSFEVILPLDNPRDL